MPQVDRTYVNQMFARSRPAHDVAFGRINLQFDHGGATHTPLMSGAPDVQMNEVLFCIAGCRRSP
jgi:hypothetical protein